MGPGTVSKPQHVDYGPRPLWAKGNSDMTMKMVLMVKLDPRGRGLPFGYSGPSLINGSGAVLNPKSGSEEGEKRADSARITRK